MSNADLLLKLAVEDWIVRMPFNRAANFIPGMKNQRAVFWLKHFNDEALKRADSNKTTPDEEKLYLVKDLNSDFPIKNKEKGKDIRTVFSLIKKTTNL